MFHCYTYIKYHFVSFFVQNQHVRKNVRDRAHIVIIILHQCIYSALLLHKNWRKLISFLFLNTFFLFIFEQMFSFFSEKILVLLFIYWWMFVVCCVPRRELVGADLLVKMCVDVECEVFMMEAEEAQFTSISFYVIDCRFVSIISIFHTL